MGETGLAATSNASMVSFMINSICIGVTMGGTVLIVQYKGANNKKGQIETVGTLFSITVIAAIIVTCMALLKYKPLFHALNVPVESMQDACQYM